MQHYELLAILTAKLDNAGEAAAERKIFDLVAKEKGAITKQEQLGKHKLAYEIQHETYGTYVLVEFDMEPRALLQLDRNVRLISEIVRYIIVKKAVKTAKQIAEEQMIHEKVEQRLARERQEQQAAAAPPPLPAAPAAEKPKGTEKKISLEDLDKKLDDILKEEI